MWLPEARGSNSITPKGDGNSSDNAGFTKKNVLPVQIPLPRKGTETLPFSCQYNQLISVQIPLPRKGTETQERQNFDEQGCVVQIPLPRKGTETHFLVCELPDEDSCSNSITPKGDGNTRYHFSSVAILTGSNSITPKGDGNVGRQQKDLA